jgi:hypothetical protein
MSDIAGRIFPAPPSLRYVVLRHEGIPNPHFDLMFETLPGSVLATWRSPIWPIDTDTPVTRLTDHRREYLDFEGALTGDRGHVQRVTTGFCRLDRLDDTRWRFTFRDFVATSQLEFRHDTADEWLAVVPHL